MIFRQLLEPVSSTYTYLLACPQTGQALLIDPVVNAAIFYRRISPGTVNGDARKGIRCNIAIFQNKRAACNIDSEKCFTVSRAAPLKR